MTRVAAHGADEDRPPVTVASGQDQLLGSRAEAGVLLFGLERIVACCAKRPSRLKLWPLSLKAGYICWTS